MVGFPTKHKVLSRYLRWRWMFLPACATAMQYISTDLVRFAIMCCMTPPLISKNELNFYKQLTSASLTSSESYHMRFVSSWQNINCACYQLDFCHGVDCAGCLRTE